MTLYIARFGGVFLALIAVGLGVLIGRVIEAIAVAAVLFAIWTSIQRLVTPEHGSAPRRDDEAGLR